MVEAHGRAELNLGPPAGGGQPAVAHCLGKEARFVEKLVAVEDALLVAGGAFLAEGKPHAFAPAERVPREHVTIGEARPK